MKFSFQKRIYGCECDIYGHLNNANYLPILEAARSEALQEMGMPIQKLLDLNWHIYVMKVELDFIKPVLLEDIIEVRSTVLEMNKVKSIWQQEVYDSSSNLCFRSILKAVFAHNGKPARLIPEIYSVFENYLK